MKSVSLWKMRKIETIEEFYTKKFGGLPEEIMLAMGSSELQYADKVLK